MRLKDHADSIGPNGVPSSAASRGDGSSGEEYLARIGIQKAGGKEKQRALPAPGGAGEKNLFIRGEREFGQTHRKAVRPGEMEVGDLKSGFHDRDDSPPARVSTFQHHPRRGR